jgi:hypothetical protein
MENSNDFPDKWFGAFCCPFNPLLFIKIVKSLSISIFYNYL